MKMQETQNSQNNEKEELRRRIHNSLISKPSGKFRVIKKEVLKLKTIHKITRFFHNTRIYEFLKNL